MDFYWRGGFIELSQQGKVSIGERFFFIKEGIFIRENILYSILLKFHLSSTSQATQIFKRISVTAVTTLITKFKEAMQPITYTYMYIVYIYMCIDDPCGLLSQSNQANFQRFIFIQYDVPPQGLNLLNRLKLYQILIYTQVRTILAYRMQNIFNKIHENQTSLRNGQFGHARTMI